MTFLPKWYSLSEIVFGSSQIGFGSSSSTLALALALRLRLQPVGFGFGLPSTSAPPASLRFGGFVRATSVSAPKPASFRLRCWLHLRQTVSALTFGFGYRFDPNGSAKLANLASPALASALALRLESFRPGKLQLGLWFQLFGSRGYGFTDSPIASARVASASSTRNPLRSTSATGTRQALRPTERQLRKGQFYGPLSSSFAKVSFTKKL